MKLNFEPTDATLGAVVTGIDLSTLDDVSLNEIENAFHEYAVLIFPGQYLSIEDQMAFFSRFGKPELLGDRYNEKFIWISNQQNDGNLYEENDHRLIILQGIEGWHTDSSYMNLAAKASLLSAHVVPSHGGQTECADMRAAFDALDENSRIRITELSAYHSQFKSQARIGHLVKVGRSYGFEDKAPPLKSLVKVHPATGRRSLFIGRHAYEIPGLDQESAEKLLSDLTTFSCQPPRTYTHQWQPGELVVWDNRCVLHRARSYDWRERRILLRARVAGDPVTEFAASA